jgi:hypothetical protein
VKTFLTALLLTLAAGLFAMDLYALLGNGFGGFLGIVGAVLGILWWRHVKGKVVPEDVDARSLGLLALVTVVLGGGLLLLAG